ncbi:MAG TPA: hypothetical protein VGR42_00470, partial [Casimicrobiaceae bacterium]|nr:hypothetical protein [Casimicrobiaceae bacterium]
MRRAFIYFLIFSLAWPLHAQKSREEKAINEIVNAATEAVVKELVKGFVDKIAASTAGSAAAAGAGTGASAASGGGSGTAATAGSYVLFAYAVGVAIKDFSKAKNDKGRAFAVADGVAAGVTLANPAVGAIVVGVLTVVKLADAKVSAHHAKKLMEVYTRIAQNYQTALDLETQMARADGVRFEYLFTQVSETQELITAGQEYLEKNCQDVQVVASLQTADECLKSVIQLHAMYKRQVLAMKAIFQVESRHVKLEAILEKMELKKEELIQQVEAYERQVDSLDAAITASLEGYGKAIATIVVESAAESGEPRDAVFKQMCLIQAKRLAIHANQNLYPQFLGDQQATPEIQRANLMQIKDEMD